MNFSIIMREFDQCVLPIEVNFEEISNIFKKLKIGKAPGYYDK